MLRIRGRIKKRKGFTLVELIVVIAILGILAALAVPRLVNTLESSKEKTDEANARIIESAVQMYYFDQDPHTYPADVDTLKDRDYLDDDFDTTPQSKKYTGYEIDIDTGKVTLTEASEG